MATLPVDLWALIAATNTQTYTVLVRVIKGLDKACPAKSWKVYFTVRMTATGGEYWMLCGKLHRCNDQPALVYKSGGMAWCQHGKLHRDNDQPAMIGIRKNPTLYRMGERPFMNRFVSKYYMQGFQEWYQHGRRHRDGDQPAVIHKNIGSWWFHHGELHRDNDQPAVILANGSMFWHHHGKFYKEFYKDNGKPTMISV